MKPIDIASEHPTYTKDHWESEAFVGDTILGYWTWVAQQMKLDGASDAKIQKQVHESGLPAEVEISVRGGVADIEWTSGNVKVNIIDYDNLEDEKILTEEQAKEATVEASAAEEPSPQPPAANETADKVVSFLSEVPEYANA